MFNGFTEQARLAVVAAQKEAQNLNHRDIGTGVMLLALTREEAGTSARALGSLGITEEAVNRQIGELIAPGQPRAPLVQIPFSPAAKQALERSPREAGTLGHRNTGPGHLLLGLLDVGNSQATEILTDLGADPRRVRQQVIELLSAGPGPDAQ